ncbi:hypothetical protein WDU94_010949 [Cyamophila willieti]
MCAARVSQNILILSTVIKIVIGKETGQTGLGEPSDQNTTLLSTRTTVLQLETTWNTRNKLGSLYAKLTKTFNRLNNLRDKIGKLRRKHHFLLKYFGYMEEHQKENVLHIEGVPTLPSDEMLIFFQKLSKSMRIPYRDKDILSIWQSTKNNRNKKTMTHPIYVKFKGRTVKNKFMGYVRSYFHRHKGQIGCKVSHGNQTFSKVCIGEYYPTDLIRFLKKASIVAKQHGFGCFINQSRVFMRINLTDVFVITNEDHLELLRKNKSARVIQDTCDARMNRVQFDVENPMMYRKINETMLKAKAKKARGNRTWRLRRSHLLAGRVDSESWEESAQDWVHWRQNFEQAYVRQGRKAPATDK